MKYKAGDTVRIRSKEWMDAQKKDEGNILGSLDDNYHMSEAMQDFAGKTAKILVVQDGHYCLDIDEEIYSWEDWMFDPDYKADKPLSVEDAIRAMLDGETLYNKAGLEYSFSNNTFYLRDNGEVCQYFNFPTLYRRPSRRKRPMTRWEVLDWANREESRGWVVRRIYADGSDSWELPQRFSYEDLNRYQRTRLLPDLSGVDESTIQGFEVEE